jgi:hypothetical protein
VAALTLAAETQQAEGHDTAGKIALGAIGVAIVMGFGIAEAGGGRAA